jgi:hypothetical protein
MHEYFRNFHHFDPINEKNHVTEERLYSKEIKKRIRNIFLKRWQDIMQKSMEKPRQQRKAAVNPSIAD